MESVILAATARRVMTHWTLLIFVLSLGLVGCNGDTVKDDTGPDCRDMVDCPEDCADGVDNDGNGDVDCDDPACAEACA